MGEEMERSVYRGDWSSELQSHLIGWSSDISFVKQIGNEAAAVCDDSMMFSEPKQICSQLQFSHELGVPSSIWGQDLLSSTSTRSATNRYYTAPVINDIQIKQEHPSSNLDSLVTTSSPSATRKAADMPPSFPATVGERRSPPLRSKARPLANGNNSPLWTAWSSGVSLSQEEQERSTTCNVPLKAQDSCMDTKKSNDENGPKRIRSDAHVPFTTFKVRKEKLGDKITALQQLVSPFGKTDTASVLFDAIECIKLLHDQVTVLSTPYMMPSHELYGTSMEREEAVRKGGLRSRGLCLVPISTTLHVAKDDTPDFWAPTFGGSFR